MLTNRHFLVFLTLVLAVSLTACTTHDEQTDTPLGNGILETTAVPVGETNPITSPLPPIEMPTSLANTPPAVSFSAIDLSDAIADIVAQVRPAVVYVLAKKQVRDYFFDRIILQPSTGSGVIMSSDGYILTNNHVVESATQLEVTLPGVVETFEAKLIGTDPLTDLAVIKIEGQEFPMAPFGDAVQLLPGNLVIALGNPLGLEGGPSITFGVVSNTERTFSLGSTAFYDVIQTDAAINPGNSGGPLVDLTGKVVGINTVIVGEAQNIGFAISANTAQPVFEALVASPHRMIRPWLGVSLATITPDLAVQEGLSHMAGVLVKYVAEDSPAEKAGMEAGDVITHFEGEQVTEATKLIKTLWRYNVGDEIEITLWHGEEEKEIIVKPAERPVDS